MRGSSTRRLLLLPLSFAALLALGVPPAIGNGTLNSTCAGGSGGFVPVWGGSKAAETFPAGNGGKLLTVDIQQLARDHSPTDPDLLVEVFGTDGTGTPVAPLLASTTLPGASINDDNYYHDYSVDFDPSTAAYLTPGQTYAVAISTPDSVQNAWGFGGGNPCTNGALFSGGPPFGYPFGETGWDANLRTYLGPPNDDFARAIVLSGEDAVASGTTAGGTRQEPDEPDHYTIGPEGDPELWDGDHSVWYRWTAPNSGPTEINTCTSMIDSILAVYTGSELNALTRVTDNNNDASCAGENPYGSAVNFTAVGGTEYQIAVGDAGGATQNTFTLAINGAPDITPPVTSLDSGPAGLPAMRRFTVAIPPDTRILKARIKGKRRRATFRFASTEQGSTFLCRLDKKPFKTCASPKTYRGLKPGKHTFQVEAVDPTGNLDSTAADRGFRIPG